MKLVPSYRQAYALLVGGVLCQVTCQYAVSALLQDWLRLDSAVSEHHLRSAFVLARVVRSHPCIPVRVLGLMLRALRYGDIREGESSYGVDIHFQNLADKAG